MGRLVFKATDVLRVVEHSINAPDQAMQAVGYNEKRNEVICRKPNEPSVVLVHDQGVYLMSNGEPRDMIKKRWRNGKGESDSSYVAYAKGCNPDTDADWYDTAHDLVGGDDFGETLPWAQPIRDAIRAGARSVIVNFGARNASLKFK